MLRGDVRSALRCAAISIEIEPLISMEIADRNGAENRRTEWPMDLGMWCRMTCCAKDVLPGGRA